MPSPTEAPPTLTEKNQVTVVFARENADAYERDSYVAVQRDGTEQQLATPQAELTFALDQLVGGPTAAEHGRGLVSPFPDEAADVIRSVQVENGHAIIDFQRLEETMPGISTSYGGASFGYTLGNTIFFVEGIDSLEFRLEGSCDDFAQRIEQGMECRVVDRTTWESDVGPSQD